MERRLIAAIACRNQGSRLYGKPLQNLDIANGVKIINNIIDCLKSIQCIDEIILGISEGVENEIFKQIAENEGLKYIIGDQQDVLGRLISCAQLGKATDIFRVTSESPFPYFEPVDELWKSHVSNDYDATFLDDIIDGSGFEIIKLDALVKSHNLGEEKHRSELCSLFIRENAKSFNVSKFLPPAELIRNDLRLTVDNPEDLVVCRKLYMAFKSQAPKIPIHLLVKYFDEHTKLKELIAPFSEEGYSSMYI
jgi:spore coat polysaccharide biosynthesis protein SpsF